MMISSLTATVVFFVLAIVLASEINLYDERRPPPDPFRFDRFRRGEPSPPDTDD